MSTAATRLIYPEVGARGTSYTFGIYANTLMNIGYFSFLLIPLFLFLISYLYIKAIKSNSRDYMSFFVIYLAINSKQLIRGGILDVRLLRLTIAFFLSYLLFRFISIQFKHSPPELKDTKEKDFPNWNYFVYNPTIQKNK